MKIALVVRLRVRAFARMDTLEMIVRTRPVYPATSMVTVMRPMGDFAKRMERASVPVVSSDPIVNVKNVRICA